MDDDQVLVPTNEITQADIDKAFKDFNVFDKVAPAVIPTPTRMFELEETVRLGGLDDIQVKEILHDGKAYRLEYTRTDKRDRTREKYQTRMTKIWWWFDVKKMNFASTEADDLFMPRLPGQVSTTAIESLLSMMAHSGVVCDPRYQRGYVWSLDDQESLIDSIFNHVNIGSLVFSRHAGYYHDKSDETVKYINLDGDEIEIPRRRDYTSAVIDGQQRMTTIWRFMTNQFAYRGHYWKDLSFRDQIGFKGVNVSTRTFEERDVPYKAVLRMFIKVNKGVPQDEKHLNAVAAQLAKLTK
ncbi:MAG: hypothetical protein DRQ39_08160 [Gammaproteobacteria bacterium]|nr:MAG: hypothetical protein DRQ39_08160 [Gammaproteobacteria bacterium]